MEFVPDIDAAKKSVVHKFFSEYSPAYVVTNESLTTSMYWMPKNCNSALTVAASGDHPFWCSLFGIKHVDTFDISYNAKCITDIKTAALGCLDYFQYIKLLENLNKCRDVTNVPYMKNILKKLSPIEADYLCAMKGFRLFDHEQWQNENLWLINQYEYSSLQESVQKPYNFIMSDISSLSVMLSQSYDFIHLSNIMDYVHNPGHQSAILLGLFKHLNIKGRIVIKHLCRAAWDEAPFAKGGMAHNPMLENVRFIKSVNDISIFERVR